MLWFRARRRRIAITLGVVVLFYLLGYFSAPVTTSLMCKVYG